MTPRRMPLSPLPVPGRVCWSCRHLVFLSGTGGYSEFTPGSDFALYCGKDYWRFENCSDTLREFRNKLQRAEQCATFATGEKR